MIPGKGEWMYVTCCKFMHFMVLKAKLHKLNNLISPVDKVPGLSFHDTFVVWLPLVCGLLNDMGTSSIWSGIIFNLTSPTAR